VERQPPKDAAAAPSTADAPLPDKVAAGDAELSRAAELDAGFRRQPHDPSAARAAMEALQRAPLKDAEAPTVTVRGLECLGATCRLELVAGQEHEIETYLANLNTRLPTAAMTTGPGGTSSGAGNALTLYITP
jgi:hypothetical protein